MKGAETFKALAEGEVVYFPDAEISYKLTPDGVPMCKWDMDSTWKKCDVLKHGVWEDECEIGEEYDLTFKEAVEAMMVHGHVCECEAEEHGKFRFNFKRSLFEEYPKTPKNLGWTATNVWLDLQTAKWKVVE